MNNKSSATPYRYSVEHSVKGRLMSLDILRGITVAGMILVNNGYGESFNALTHSKWNGMTPCDLVFPFFLFIMGVSMCLSFSKHEYKLTRPLAVKIVRRFLVLFLIGLFINWFELAINGHFFDFENLRIWGVMQRIAICYLIVSLLVLTLHHKWLIPTVLTLLITYGLILWLGNGYVQDASNVIAKVDNSIFSSSHLYHKSPVDPEGLLSTISSVAHVLIGFCVGWQIKRIAFSNDKTRWLLILGIAMLIAGLLLSFLLPLNKRVWSPSYVLATCGLASLLWGILIWLIDSKGYTASIPFFLAFGVNPLAIYVLSELLAIVLGHIGVSQAVYDAIHSCVAHLQTASLLYALYFVLLNYLCAFLFYKKRMFIKL